MRKQRPINDLALSGGRLVMRATTRSRRLSTLTAIGLWSAALVAVSAQSSQADVSPNPPSPTPPTSAGLLQCTSGAQDNSSACINGALQDFDAARAKEGLGAMALPSNWTGLTDVQQAMTLINIEREDRGETPFYAQSLSDSQDALAVANGATAPYAWMTMNKNPLYGVFYSLYDPTTSWGGFNTRDVILGADLQYWEFPGTHVGVGSGAHALGVTIRATAPLTSSDIAWLWNDEVGSFVSGTAENPTPPFPWTVPTDPPTGVTAYVTDNVLYGSWDASSIDHLWGYRGELRGYRAGKYVGGGGFNNSASRTTTSWSVLPCAEYSLSIQVMNTVGPGPAATTYLQTGGCPPLAGTTTTLTVTADQATTQQLGATGGIGYGYTYTLVPNSLAPPGVTLSPSGALVTNIPMNNIAPVETNLSYTVTDHNGTSAQGALALTIDPGHLYWRTPSTLPTAQVGHGYATIGLKVARGWSSSTCAGCGGDKFTLVRGTLPPGMWLTPLGAFSGKQQVLCGGTPRTAGAYAFLLQATDQHGNSTRQWFRINVAR